MSLRSRVPLLGIAAFLMADDDDRQTMKARGATNDCRIIGESPIAMQLDELVK